MEIGGMFKYGTQHNQLVRLCTARMEGQAPTFVLVHLGRLGFQTYKMSCT